MKKKSGIEELNDFFDRKTPYGKYEGIVVFFLALLLSVALLVSVAIIQFDVYDSYFKQRYFYLIEGYIGCFYLDYSDVNLVMTPLSAFLLIIFMFLYKRRQLCTNKCNNWRNIGLPMITSLWNKTDRTKTGLVYGRIAYEVFLLIQNIAQGNPNNTGFTLPPGTKDPTGLFNLLMKVFDMLLIGIRYYPILVAFRAKSCLIYILASIYMWLDLANTVYIQGKCDSITYDDLSDGDIKRMVGYWIGYKVVNVIPTLFFSSYLAINLSYRSLITLFQKHRLTIDDDYEVFYAPTDILFVIDVFNNKQRKKDDNNLEIFTNIFNKVSHGAKITLPAVEEVHTVRVDGKLKAFIRRFIYDWSHCFKFTSRFVNTQIVAYLALYHFSMFILYYLVYVDLLIQNNLSMIDFNNLANLTVGDITCWFGEDFCLQDLSWPLPIPKTIVTFGPSFIPSINALLITPFFGALFVCSIQLFIGICDTKKHLMEIYKGKCTYLPPIKELSNASIASSSFHYGGYLTGYLIWGFLIQYVVIVLLGLVIIILRASIGDKIFLQILLKIVPIICVLIVKQVVNTIASRLVFLRRDTKILALDNFRAFNVFLYFNFFFDCFMGLISAIVRIIKSIAIAILMMPRIAYGFFGRLFERKDNGYSAYTGFLYMEAGHTNPIMITFCSLLYYKGLSNHVRKKYFESSKDHELTRFNPMRNYKKRIVNKWHVLYFLTKNPILLMYRRDNLIHCVVSKPKKGCCCCR